jgi:membrane fusion protein, multidrug efflux system
MEHKKMRRTSLPLQDKQPAKVSKRLFICICLLGFGIFFLTGCSETQSEQPAVKPAAPVTVGAVSLRDVPVQVRAIGSVEPYNTAGIRAQVGGTLARVHFTEGQEVKKGSLLFTIDSRQYEASLKQAEAALARSRAQFENAKKDAGRYAELVSKGYVSQEQYEQLRTNADALESVVQADLAQVDNAKLQLGYCFIYAPVSGRTGSLLLHEGNLVKANADAPMVVIHQVQPVNVAFTVPEKFFSEIRKYTGSGKLLVEAFPPSEEDRPVKGTLSFTDNTVDRATGTIMMKAVFPNSDGRLWPGQFVNVVMTVAVQQKATVVPSAAVQTGQEGHFVYVVNGNTAELRQIKAGATAGGVTVVNEGLTAGEQVITDGQMRLVPGSSVEIKQLHGAES